jgi:2-isopropylmalate synthase
VPSSAGMAHDTTIYDTTLRDGCQGAGISLALRDKLDIARRLDEAGVDYVEGGWPGSNPKDAEFFAAIRETPLRHARVSAFGSTRRPGVDAADDENLRLLVTAETPTVALVAKAWDFHVRDVLHTTPEENLAMVADSVAYAKAHGREVVFDAEHFFDGYRANRDYALAVLRAAAGAGADWLVLCDTNGGSLPDQVAAAVREIVAAFDVPVGIHAHDDGSLAVANSLAAVAAGATQVQGTINGYGERVGNANLCSIVPNLALKMGRSCEAGARLGGLTGLSRYVDDVANVVSNPRLPFVGWSAFAHKGGIHVHAVAGDPTTYEHVDPALVGNERHILVGELSGRSNVVERARELGFDLDPRGGAAKAVADRIKELERDGFQLEDAEASFELLVRRAEPGYRPPLEALTYRVDSSKGEEDERSLSSAVVAVAVDGNTMTGQASGGGPVDALEKAFRQALAPAYPDLERVTLTNFRAQIVGGRSGTRAPVRVRITGSRPDDAPWTTVGCSSDLLHASWLALADCFEYAVLTRDRAADEIQEVTA